MLLEGAVEIGQVVEAHVKGDVDDLALRFHQQLFRRLDAPRVDIARDRGARDLLEQLHHVILVHVEAPGEGQPVVGFSEVLVEVFDELMDRVARLRTGIVARRAPSDPSQLIRFVQQRGGEDVAVGARVSEVQQVHQERAEEQERQPEGE